MDKIDAKILIVDDDQDVLLAAKLFLNQHFNIVHTEKDSNNIHSLLGVENYDLILLDMNFSKDATSGKEDFDPGYRPGGSCYFHHRIRRH